ncbi:MAG: hypothetical protein J6C86_11160 [Bacteroidaceae bacterium]|nr:hypothetical protein [Bacteroidaceae bacterium]
MAVDISGMMSENVMLIDAEYVDKVAFDLSVNFERMLERRIPKADLAHWLDCVALDGGIEPGNNEIQVIFLYDKKRKKLENFIPTDMENEIGGMAFKDNIGEFAMEAYPVAEDMTTKEDFYMEALKIIMYNEKTKCVMLLPDVEKYGMAVKDFLCKNRSKNKGKEVTLFAMEPQTGTGFGQQILGYSIMSALGISGKEIG